MEHDNLETLQHLWKFAKGKVVSAYNSELFQNFMKEYTGEALKEKIAAGRVAFIEAAKDAKDYLSPRYKLAKAKAIAATEAFLKFSGEQIRSARNSELFHKFKQSAFYAKCQKYGKKAALTVAISGALFAGGKFTKHRVDYMNSDAHKYEIMKENEGALFATIVHSENYSDEAYLDNANVPTKGYGTTIHHDGKKVSLKEKPITRTLTQAELDAYDSNTVQAAFGKAQNDVIAHLEKNVYPALLKIDNFRKLSQNQQVALGLFCYNVGMTAFNNSSVLKELNNGNTQLAMQNMLKYNKVKDKKGKLVFARGLQKRRLYEYMIATGAVPLKDVVNMPVASLYSDDIYYNMYKGKTAKDFAGDVAVLPSNNEYRYAEALMANPEKAPMITVRECITEKCYQDILKSTNAKTEIALRQTNTRTN